MPPSPTPVALSLPISVAATTNLAHMCQLWCCYKLIITANTVITEPTPPLLQDDSFLSPNRLEACRPIVYLKKFCRPIVCRPCVVQLVESERTFQVQNKKNNKQ